MGIGTGYEKSSRNYFAFMYDLGRTFLISNFGCSISDLDNAEVYL
jgi:hypothetical protein